MNELLLECASRVWAYAPFPIAFIAALIDSSAFSLDLWMAAHRLPFNGPKQNIVLSKMNIRVLVLSGFAVGTVMVAVPFLVPMFLKNEYHTAIFHLITVMPMCSATLFVWPAQRLGIAKFTAARGRDAKIYTSLKFDWKARKTVGVIVCVACTCVTALAIWPWTPAMVRSAAQTLVFYGVFRILLRLVASAVTANATSMKVDLFYPLICLGAAILIPIIVYLVSSNPSDPSRPHGTPIPMWEEQINGWSDLVIAFSNSTFVFRFLSMVYRFECRQDFTAVEREEEEPLFDQTNIDPMQAQLQAPPIMTTTPSESRSKALAKPYFMTGLCSFAACSVIIPSLGALGIGNQESGGLLMVVHLYASGLAVLLIMCLAWIRGELREFVQYREDWLSIPPIDVWHSIRKYDAEEKGSAQSGFEISEGLDVKST